MSTFYRNTLELAADPSTELRGLEVALEAEARRRENAAVLAALDEVDRRTGTVIPGPDYSYVHRVTAEIRRELSAGEK